MSVQLIDVMRERMAVRASRAILTWTVRGHAAEGTAWGEALIGELGEAETPAAAIWWALTSLPLAWRERRNLRRQARAQATLRARVTRRAILSAAIVVIAGFVINWVALTVVDVPSPSMAPTLGVSSRVLVDKIGYHLDGLSRGDVVVVNLPKQFDGRDNVIKRIAGLAGDHMACDATGALTRNGVVVASASPAQLASATQPASVDSCPAVTVPAGDVYLIGDNFFDSLDSRMIGPVPASSVVGRVMSKVWPL